MEKNYPNASHEMPTKVQEVITNFNADQNITDYLEVRIRRDLELLHEISTFIINEEDIDEILGKALDIMQQHMGFIRGTITIFNRKLGKIYTKKGFGISKEERARGVYSLGEGITGEVVESGKPIIVPHVVNDPRFLNRTGSRITKADSDISFLSIPIKAGKEVIGTINADRHFTGDFPLEEDLKMLQIIAAMVSQATQLYRAHHEEHQTLQAENKRLQEALQDRYHPSNIIGNSKAMVQVYDMVDRIAKTDATVLILGESGVGKELVSHAIHYNSLRSKFPFVKLNCAALPPSVIESELFGHEKGAFTGAINTRQGRFEIANKGSIFLDEIGELSLEIQTKLLRVLQEREFERVGGSITLKTDVRIIAATNKDLEEKIKTGEFREDLYYRLNVIPVTVPPLRDRKSDILLLANFFVEKYSDKNNKTVKRISTPAIDMLMSYHWPGNVRELENCIEHAVVLSDDEVIHGFHLPPTLQLANPKVIKEKSKGTLQQQIDSLEYELIVEALKATGGNLSKTAQCLGLTNRMIGFRAKKYNLNFKDFRRGNYI